MHFRSRGHLDTLQGRKKWRGAEQGASTYKHFPKLWSIWIKLPRAKAPPPSGNWKAVACQVTHFIYFSFCLHYPLLLNGLKMNNPNSKPNKQTASRHSALKSHSAWCMLGKALYIRKHGLLVSWCGGGTSHPQVWIHTMQLQPLQSARH